MTIAKENNTIEIKENKREKKSNKRILTSLILLLTIIPFFVLSGISNYWYNEGYNYFFVSILLVVFVYGIYELVNFINPYKDDKKLFLKNFLLLSIFLGGILIFFYIKFLNNYDYNFLETFSDGILSSSDPNLEISLLKDYQSGRDLFIMVVLLVGALDLVFMLVNSYEEGEIKDSLVMIIVSNLLLSFFISIFYINLVLNWSMLFLILLTTASTDVFAYLGGKKFGKKKAFPNISPNKTVEGLYIGVISGFFFGMILLTFIIYLPTSNLTSLPSYYENNSVFFLMLIVLFISMLSPLGDLFFSKIKRTYDKKDFSNLLPGHGGMLDRIDSHVFTMSISFIMLNIIFIL